MNIEVDQLIENLPGFMPTKARNEYRGKINPTACGVVNMDVSTGSGTHFVCFFNNPSREHAIYYDSYACLPPEEIQTFLKSSGKTICYNTTQHQPINSVLCGYYCVYVLRELTKGRKYMDVLNDFSFEPQENEQMLIKEFNL